LFHAAWLFGLGIVAARLLWLRPSWVLIALAILVLLCAAAALRSPGVAWLPVALLWCLLGAWCAEMEPQPAPAPALAAMSDDLQRTLEATITDAGPVREEADQDAEDVSRLAPALRPTQRIDVRVSSIEKVTDEEDALIPVDGAVRLTVRLNQTGERPFQCGERMRATGRLLPPAVYHDPGAFSRAGYLLDQGITAASRVEFEGVERLGQSRFPARLLSGRAWQAAEDWLHCRLSAAQRASSDRLLTLPSATQSLPAPLRITEDDAIMLAAMVTGDRTFLSHTLRVGFERTGSFHMLVVSGFHLAIVAGCVFWIAKRLRVPRVPATLITLGASFAYAFFTGFATPVQRSLWMVLLYLLGRLVYRERSPLNTIGFAALCLLVASPRSLFDSGFQMTLLAVVSIGGVAMPLLQSTVHPYLDSTRQLDLVALDVKLPPLQAQFRFMLRMIAGKMEPAFSHVIAWRAFPWLVRYLLRLCELLVVACVVELAMTFPMAVYFHRITIFALPVNLLILPLLLVLMPAALVTLLALLMWPAAAQVPAAITALLLHFGVWLVHLFGSLALGDFRIPAPLLGQAAFFCTLLGAAIALARGGKWPRRAAWAALTAAAIVAVMPRAIQHPRDALIVEAIDVGQGDSILLISPDGKTLLVDGGGFGGGPRPTAQEFDIGEEVVSAALWSRGIRHLDVVALSHAHSDHMGGLPAVLRNFHPDELWVGNNPRGDAYDALLNEAAALHVKVRSLQAEDATHLGNVQVSVFAPAPNYQPGKTPANNDSLVLRAAYGGTSVLLEGDAEAPVEESMLAASGLGSTLLKVGHHGSVTSTQPEFLARVAPQWAVISCGLHNRYGHPRPEVLAELQNAKIRTYSTDINGAMCFRLDGKTAGAEGSCESDR
jgi:competence protein ComEC